MNTETPFYILSAARSDLDVHENAARSETLHAQLRAQGIAVAECTGCYHGTTESSLIVFDNTPGTLTVHDTVMRLARVYGQESVLAIDANRAASLIYCDDGRLESLGILVNVSRADAEQCDAWTERAGQFYVCI